MKFNFPRARNGNVAVAWDLETAPISVLEEDNWTTQLGLINKFKSPKKV